MQPADIGRTDRAVDCSMSTKPEPTTTPPPMPTTPDSSTSLRWTCDDLRAFPPSHAWFVGLDSDGCVLDTVTLKQVRGLLPAMVDQWGLESIEPQVRETVEFVCLHSVTRGLNRYAALVRVFDELRRRPDVRAAGARVPDPAPLRHFVQSGLPLSQPSLEAAAHRSPEPLLKQALAWSRAANERIARLAGEVRAFPGAAEALEKLAADADLGVCSQSPEAALMREWEGAGLLHRVRFIAGQELGGKADQLRLATAGKYAAGRVLFVGDAPGDRHAAEAAGVAFFPILPGRETESWRRLTEEAFPRLKACAYDAAYQRDRCAEFEAALPARPPWAHAAPP